MDATDAVIDHLRAKVRYHGHSLRYWIVRITTFLMAASIVWELRWILTH